MDLTNGFTPYGYAIIPNLWIMKKGQEIFLSFWFICGYSSETNTP